MPRTRETQRRTKETQKQGSVPVKSSSRICFGIDYFTSEADAREYARTHKGAFNGGYRHGSPTGRDINFDHTDDVLGKLFAVTVP